MVQCVYKISCVDENIKEFYIGSTEDFKTRIKKHIIHYQTDSNRKLYNFIRENGGLSNWEINPIEIFSFLTELELRQHEQFYMDEYKPQLNCIRAYRSKEQLKEYNKNFYKNNSDYYNKFNNRPSRKEKGNCPHCNLEMRKDSIKRHIKRKHTTTSTE